MLRECCCILLVVSCIDRLTASVVEVELSTCNPQLSNESLSLCCRTRNFPRSSTVVFRKLDESKQTSFITTVTSSCQTSPSNNNQDARFDVTCSHKAGWEIYRLTFDDVIQSDDLGLWWCGYYDDGSYGASSTFSMEANKVLASHRYLHVDPSEPTVLSWQLKKESANTTILDPRSNIVLRMTGENVTFILPRYSWRIYSGQVSISWNITAPEDSGTYVIAYDENDVKVVREGITLVVQGIPTEPTIQSEAFGFDDTNYAGDFMVLSCTSQSTSAAPLFYEPEMTYRWMVYPENAVNTSQMGDNLYIHGLSCKSNVSVGIFCEASERELKRNNSRPFQPQHSWFCNSDTVPEKSPPPSPSEEKSDKGMYIIALTVTSIGLIFSVVVPVVLGRRRIVRRLRGCRDKDVCCCSRVAKALLYFCDTVEEEESEEESEMNIADMLEAQRQSEVAARRRRDRLVSFDNLGINLDVSSGGPTPPDGASASSLSDRGARPQENVNELLRQLNRHLQQEPVNLEVYRDNIVNNLIGYYASEPNLPISRVITKMLGEGGYDCGGVTEDMFTTFWNRVWEDELFVGCEVVVPHLHTHDMSEKHKFLTLGRILSHTVAVTQSFPIPLSRCAIMCMVLNTYDVDKDAVLQDFLYYLESEDRHVVQKAMKDFDSLSSDDTTKLQNIFTRFEYGAVLKEHTWKGHLHTLANDVICSKPRPLLDEMRKGIPETHFQHFWSVLDIYSLGTIFQVQKPSPNRVIGRIKTDVPEVHLEECQKKSLDMLRRFICELTTQELENLLQFITGSKSMPRTMITVEFTTQVGLLRSPKAHTCSNMMELPETYESYDTFRSEMKNLLESDEAFRFGIA